jgi:hypothetical protein
MAFKKTFVLSDESINTYGFRVITDGIKLDAAKKNCPAYFNHKTWEIPLGHWENLRKEDGKLLGDLIIEGANESEKEYIRKIENGDIKGASVGLDPLEWNNEPANLIQGQTGSTLMVSELFEASLAPLNGNKNALALKGKDGFVTLSNDNKENLIPTLKNENMKEVAILLGLNENSNVQALCDALRPIMLKADKVDGLEKTVQELTKGMADGLSEAKKNFFLELSKTNMEGALQFLKLSKAETPEDENTEVEEVENATANKVTKNVKVTELIKKGNGAQAQEADGKNSFDYLQKHNSVELGRIRAEEPERYSQLAADYAKGVRYQPK